MVDVARMARAPHPVGSAEHAVVQAYLMKRLADLGLEPQRQIGALSPTAVRRVETQGASADGLMAVNLVGVLPGRRADLPAVALMAHYDSVPGSPGAADDAAGVAAILEAVRAVKARGQAERTLVVLLTDAEELNLDGARAFFSEHPLRDRIGAVINLEARGGGGRAMMFETGLGNAPTIDRFAEAAPRITGGASANALAVFVYRLMPNGTDFTIAADRSLAGINLAFIGRPAQYHAAGATPQALDKGSVQHIGSQALEMADILLRGPDLPKAGQDAVHADLFGLIVLHHAPGFGWVLLAAAVALTAFAAWGARHSAGLRAASVGRGVLDGLWLVSAGVVVAQAVRGLAGPVGARVDSAAIYYALLRRLPWIEVAAALAVLAVVLALLAGPRAVGRKVMAGMLALATVASTVMGGASALSIGAGLLSVVLSLRPQPDQASDGTALGRMAGPCRPGPGGRGRGPGRGARGGLHIHLDGPGRLAGRRRRRRDGRADQKPAPGLDRPGPAGCGDCCGRRLAAGPGAFRLPGRGDGPARRAGPDRPADPDAGQAAGADLGRPARGDAGGGVSGPGLRRRAGRPLDHARCAQRGLYVELTRHVRNGRA